jgi:hypothetical protein
VSGGSKARFVHVGGGKELKGKPRAKAIAAPDPRLAAFMDKLADLLVADLLRKPSDRR